jgi:hypothetical protein
LYVGYACDGTQLVTAGVGNIFGLVSTVEGSEGFAGPFSKPDSIPDGIVLGPNASDPNRVWGNADRGAQYVDQITVYQLLNGTWAALIGSVTTWFAISQKSVLGPWKITGPASSTAFNKSPLSAYNENPAVQETKSFLDSKQRADFPGFIALLDTVFNEQSGFGVTWSFDGTNWIDAVDVTLSGGARTPLGIIPSSGFLDDEVTVFFTRRFADCRNQTQQNDCGGFGMAMPTQCANIYSARFQVTHS